LYEKFPYKDIAKSWKIDVEIDHKNGITLRHRKKEQSHLTEPQNFFSFEWRFEITFNKNMTNFTAEVHISDWWFSDQINPQVKYDVEAALFPYVKGHTFYKRYVEQPLEARYIYEHLITLGSSIQLVDANSVPLYIPSTSSPT